MNFISRFFFFIIVCTTFFSCKNEVKSEVENSDNDATELVIAPVPVKKANTKNELSKDVDDQVNSVMVKSMITPELKTFSSILVTTGLVEMLSKKEGPFTIIGPSNEAYTRLGQMQMKVLLNTENKDELLRLTEGHIIKGKLDSGTLVQKIKDGKGSYEIISMSGVTFVASMEGATIVVTDGKGVAARIGKSDIQGSNGVVHVLDRVLSVN